MDAGDRMTDNAALCMTTRETWAEQWQNATLADLEDQLQKVRGLPGAYDLLERIAARLEDLEATR